MPIMQTNDLPRIGVLSADPAAVTQFLRRVQALGADPTALLPLSPAAVPDCEPYLCGTSTQSPLPKLRAAAEVLAASGCTVIAVPDSAGVFCEEITAAVGIPTLGVSGPALQQLVGKLRQRASVLCTPGVRAANGYGIAARRYGLYCSYPDAPVQALLGCVQPEKACSEQVLRSIIELELARGNDSVVLDSAQLCAAFAHFGLAAHYPQAADGMELLAQAALLHTAAAADARRARIPERRHRLRVRDRVGRVHVHGRESCVRELRHRLRDLRVREIDARTRAVADRLHHGLIPLRRRDGGVCRSFGLCRRLLPAGRQQQRRCAQQAAKNSFHARTSRHFLQTVYTKKFGIANFAASAILSEMDAVRCRRESAAAAEGVTLSGKRTGG